MLAGILNQLEITVRDSAMILWNSLLRYNGDKLFFFILRFFSSGKWTVLTDESTKLLFEVI